MSRLELKGLTTCNWPGLRGWIAMFVFDVISTSLVLFRSFLEWVIACHADVWTFTRTLDTGSLFCHPVHTVWSVFAAHSHGVRSHLALPTPNKTWQTNCVKRRRKQTQHVQCTWSCQVREVLTSKIQKSQEVITAYFSSDQLLPFPLLSSI